jgi:hypothetical protein
MTALEEAAIARSTQMVRTVRRMDVASRARVSAAGVGRHYYNPEMAANLEMGAT